MPAPNPVLVEATRGSLVENRYRGSAVVIDSTERRLAGSGEVGVWVFPRPAVKPLQALPLVESGAANRFAVSPVELALACGSHGGEPAHIQAVHAWLARLGLSEDDLICGAHPPLTESAALALARAGVTPGRLHNNCSGKHTGFLALSFALGRGYDRLRRSSASGPAGRPPRLVGSERRRPCRGAQVTGAVCRLLPCRWRRLPKRSPHWRQRSACRHSAPTPCVGRHDHRSRASPKSWGVRVSERLNGPSGQAAQAADQGHVEGDDRTVVAAATKDDIAKLRAEIAAVRTRSYRDGLARKAAALLGHAVFIIARSS